MVNTSPQGEDPIEQDIEKLPNSNVALEEQIDAQPSSKLVGWDSDDDEHNPLNWKPSHKWRQVMVLAMMTLITPLGSSMFAPAVPQVMEDFHSTNADLSIFVLSIYILGFAVGPLVVAPLSEIYGRKPVYLISALLFTIFTILCAVSTTLDMLIICRFLAGCAGSTPITIGGATIGDMFRPEARGLAMAVWGIGPMMGPVLGPVIGGFLGQAKGWRWVFWFNTMVAGVITILGFLFVRETYAVVLLERKTKRLIRETGDDALVSILHDGIQFAERFKRAIIRPMKMLILSPIVLLLSIYTAILFGYLYFFITSFPKVFHEQYHFNTDMIGLTYLGIGVGNFIGLGILGRISDPSYVEMTKKNNGIAKPEFRLPLLMLSSPLIVVSFFWYGWAAQKKAHWIVPIIGTSLFGTAMMPGFNSINMYLVDTYKIYAASALAANAVLRSVLGAVVPLAGPKLFENLGLGWGNSVLAFVALAFVPVPWLLFKYGEKIRTKFLLRL